MRDTDPYDFDESDIKYTPITEKYKLSFDPLEVDAPAMMIVQLVSYVDETSPLSLPQLQSSIDSESLDSWLSATENPRKDFEVSFDYAGYQVYVNGNGEVSIQPEDDSKGNGDSRSS